MFLLATIQYIQISTSLNWRMSCQWHRIARCKTNSDEVFSLFQEVKPKNGFWKLPNQRQAGRTPSNTKNQAAKICEEIVSPCYEASSVRPTSLKKSSTLAVRRAQLVQIPNSSQKLDRNIRELTDHANVCHKFDKLRGLKCLQLPEYRHKNWIVY